MIGKARVEKRSWESWASYLFGGTNEIGENTVGYSSNFVVCWICQMF